MPERPSFVQISPKILAPRLPELGAIKIGGKGAERTSRRGTKFRLPEKYDHFVITRRERDGKTENLVRDEAIHALIGDRPTELDVRLLWDRDIDSFQSYLAAYDGRQLACRGNGEVADDAQHGQVPCTCPWFKGHQGEYKGPRRSVGANAPTCKPHGRLSVILEAAQAFGGYYVFRTTSWETISNLSSQLQLFYNQFGFLAGLPLKLVIYPATDTYTEGGQQKTSTSYKVALLLRGDFDTARQIAAATYERRSQLALPSPAQADAFRRDLDEEDAREAAEISAEFHPEAGADAVAAVAEAEEQDPEADRLEEIIRYTLELADWEKDRINRQLAKSGSDLPGLAAKLAEQLPMEWTKANEDFARNAAAAEEQARAEGILVDDGEEADPQPEEEPQDAELVDDGDDALEAELQPTAAATAEAPKSQAARPALGAEELL